MLVGFRSRLWVLVAKCALSRTGSALAVESITETTARTMSLEIVGRSFGIDSRFFTQTPESPAHASCGEVRRRGTVLAEDVLNVTLVKKCLDFLVGKSAFGESFTRVTIECGSVSGGEDGPVLGWGLLNTAVAVERAAGLPRELGVLPFLGLPEHAQRPAIEVDIVPEESIASLVTGVTNDFGGAAAREREHAYERAVAHFGGCFGAILVDGIVSALVNESK
jgi:hypothetical protein